MNKIFIFTGIFLTVATYSFSQKIIRSSLSSFGNASNENGTIYRQTTGQSSSTSACHNGKTSLRQGFQQPVLPAKPNASKVKECTLLLSPNPASELVSIHFLEEIGENQISVFDVMGKLHFRIDIVSDYYEMDISELPRGIYLINVLSRSGYRCNQKLIVL